ncbi:MAG: DHCW motif cupin fold protein [Cytophagales bacterium]|nr:DHCW motif cupin fold protein [Cytophagales bacterium]
MYTIPFQTTDWNTQPEEIHPGETGQASWRTIHYGDLRIRLVHYSENYLADHWCKLGHILFCIEGDMTTEVAGNPNVTLGPGMSYQVSDDLSSHRTSSRNGAKLFVVDGGFLKGPTK